MFCLQCGFELKCGYQFCPKCGLSIHGVEQSNPQNEIDRIADDLFQHYPDKKAKAVKVLRERTGLSLQDAKDVMDMRYLGAQYVLQKQQRRQDTRIERQQFCEKANYERQMSKAIKKVEKKNKVVRCPRCRSISVSYTPKPSLGKAVIGYGFAGDVGAVVGSMMGKKGYAVCLNCGKAWKI